MSLLKIDPRELKYILKQFDSKELHDILREYLFDCYIFVLFYLPDDNARKKYRTINKVICDSRFITVYWYKDPEILTEHDTPYILKRETRSFVRLWFDLLLHLENSVYLSNMYNNIIK